MMQLWKSIHRWVVDRPLKQGDKIGHQYEIKSAIGMGSYGMTYLVSTKDKKEWVAKQLRKTKQHTKQGKQSFDYEVKVLQAIQHSQIPTLHEVIQDQGRLFIIMDYVNGKTFEDLIFVEGKTYTESEALYVLLQVIEVVTYIHKQGIVHRDLRIPNVLFVEDEICIIDFGLARFIGDQDEAAPLIKEQQRMREVSFKSDIYALGHFLLFLLYSSYKPTSKQERSWEEELGLSPFLNSIIRRMLQLDPPYETIEQVKQDVHDYLKIDQ
ncbi:serine/threonine protein kinase [Metabacillus iocasae]|uniref:Serine/threonine-protein kinase n=1 Tax=Priestia iocasae TaxID=2291674 RepID=A0ABS2QWN7_9BACI|nr:serine/threonine-protein kinase [Metabacillus iocasae]MBM7703171.1 serine/threonine-protein kinase [Metabacillus iocasae]